MSTLAPRHAALFRMAANELDRYGTHDELVRDIRDCLACKTPQAPQRQVHFDVAAHLSSDDGNMRFDVEAATWLSTLSDTRLAAVCLDPGGGEDTDQLCWWLLGSAARSGHGPSAAQMLFDYLDVLNAVDDIDPVGFTVHLDPEALRAWACINRPQAFALYEADKAP